MKLKGWLFFAGALLSLSSNTAAAPPDQAYQIHVGPPQMLRSLSGEGLQVGNSVTLEAWVNFEEFGEFNRLIIGKAADEFGHDWDFRFWIDDRVYNDSGDGPLGFMVSRASEGLDSIVVGANIAVPIGEWIHIAGTYNSSGASIYINGSLAGSVGLQTAELDRGLPLVIGTAHPDGFRGAVRQVRLWNRVLAADELMHSAQGNSPQDAEGLLGHWPLDDGRGQLARNLADGPGLALGFEGLTEELFGIEPAWQFANPFFEIREDLAFDIPGDEFGNSIPAYAVISDLNDDGVEDVLLSSAIGIGEQLYPIRIVMSDGSGGYYEGAQEKFAGEVPESLATFKFLVEDFNGDGRPDLYAGNAGRDDTEQKGERDFYYLADETGKWVESFASHISARPCTESAPVFTGQIPCASTPEGGFLYPANVGSAEPLLSLNGVAAGDIDNDGDIDIFVGAATDEHLTTTFDINRSEPYFLINDGTGHLVADWQRIPQELIHSKSHETNNNELLLTDLDGDGLADLLILGRGDTGSCCAGRHFTDGESYVFWNPGDGNFAQSDALMLPNVEHFDNADNLPHVMDIDGDGDTDIIIARTSVPFEGSFIQVLVNHGNRIFVDETQSRFPIQSGNGFETLNLRSPDINQDGCPDILNSVQIGYETGPGYNPDMLWLNDCDGNFRRTDRKFFHKPGYVFPVNDASGDLDFISYHLAGFNFADFAMLDSVRPFKESQPPYPSMVLTNGVSGAWFDPSHDGEGWLIEILDQQRALVFWFSYPPAGESGEQAWFFGLGEIIGNRIKVDEMLITSGGVFGPQFDPSSVQYETWGRAEFIFDDCSNGTMSYDGPDNYGSGTLQLVRLVNLQGTDCTGPASPAEPKSVYLPINNAEVGYFRSGSWYDPSHDGEGFLLEILDETTAIIFWFTYDDQGNQAWMLGVGSINGKEIVFDLIELPTGTVFGPGFDPGSVVRTSWGVATMTFHNCASATLSYSSSDDRFGDGEQDTVRLTSIDDLNCF